VGNNASFRIAVAARVVRRWLTRASAGLAAAILLYAAAGLSGGLIPSGGTPADAAGDVTVWVESNGVHTGIVVPKVAAGIDWRPLVPARDLRDPRYGAHAYLSFGWGERDFYLNTPSWWDVRPRTVLAAALGSDRTLMHVDHLARPAPDSGARPIRLTTAQYRRLAGFIRNSFAGGVGTGGALPGYFGWDAFYPARGRYSAVRTCNSWTGEALRAAGVRVGWWTPFPVTVTWWFPADGPR